MKYLFNFSVERILNEWWINYLIMFLLNSVVYTLINMFVMKHSCKVEIWMKPGVGEINRSFIDTFTRLRFTLPLFLHPLKVCTSCLHHHPHTLQALMVTVTRLSESLTASHDVKCTWVLGWWRPDFNAPSVPVLLCCLRHHQQTLRSRSCSQLLTSTSWVQSFESWRRSCVCWSCCGSAQNQRIKVQCGGERTPSDCAGGGSSAWDDTCWRSPGSNLQIQNKTKTKHGGVTRLLQSYVDKSSTSGKVTVKCKQRRIVRCWDVWLSGINETWRTTTALQLMLQTC